MQKSLYCFYAYPFFGGRDACAYAGGGSEHTSHIHQNPTKSINTLLIRKMYKSVRKRENLKNIKLAQTTKITFIINDDK